MFPKLTCRNFSFLVVVAVLIFSNGCSDSTGLFNQDNVNKDPDVKTLKVAVVSSNSRFCDVDTNLKHFERFIIEAKHKGARLVCFPELSLTSCAMDSALLGCAEKIPGPLTDKIGEMTSKHDIYISVGMFEKDDDGKYYITQIISGPKGFIGKYRKYHQAPGGEDLGFSPGESFPVFDIDGFKLGINICFDGRYWDTIEAMRQAGVDVIHHPHGNLTDHAKDARQWTQAKLFYLPVRAIYARAYILVNNSAGDTISPGLTSNFCGGAVIIDPLGQVIARTIQQDRHEHIIFATLKKPVTSLIPQREANIERYRFSHHPWK